MAILRRSFCLMLTIFTLKQFWILQILTTYQKKFHNFYKERYSQSKVGGHIITGVPHYENMPMHYTEIFKL